MDTPTHATASPSVSPSAATPRAVHPVLCLAAGVIARLVTGVTVGVLVGMGSGVLAGVPAGMIAGMLVRLPYAERARHRRSLR
ncbi:hypothetical protein [Streptosporangium sp. NPDC049046]|uniref:hypothetical protein n=1 Tax=unclassified Streptosporangium TaxID=2632669 RepID=UPI00342BFB4B